jgi:hypothetical protein
VTDLRVPLDDETAARILEEAAKRGMTPEQLASEVIEQYVAPVVRNLPFVGIGRSGRDDLSEQSEEILRRELGA